MEGVDLESAVIFLPSVVKRELQLIYILLLRTQLKNTKIFTT